MQVVTLGGPVSKPEHRFIINEITINPKSRTEEMMLQTGFGHANLVKKMSFILPAHAYIKNAFRRK